MPKTTTKTAPKTTTKATERTTKRTAGRTTERKDSARAKPLATKTPSTTPPATRPSRTQAEAAITTLLSYVGENPTREGLLETPARVIRAFEERTQGYTQDPLSLLRRTFSETAGYDEIVLLANVDFVSQCEHHLLPIVGKVHIGYLPSNRIVGISKLARVVEIFARRLQVQEKFTAQVAGTINEALKPRGVGVIVEATHHCMSGRGVSKHGVVMTTSSMLGSFRTKPSTRAEFLSLVEKAAASPGR